MTTGDIRQDDFYNLLAKETNLKNATTYSAEVYMDALYRIMLKELKLNGRIKIPGIGIFEANKIKSHAVTNNLTDDGGIFWIDERLAIRFRPLKQFKRDVNENNFETSKKKKRKKKVSYGREVDKLQFIDSEPEIKVNDKEAAKKAVALFLDKMENI